MILAAPQHESRVPARPKRAWRHRSLEFLCVAAREVFTLGGCREVAAVVVVVMVVATCRGELAEP